MDLSLKTSMPWLVLAGSGGLADFLTDILETVSSAPVVPSSCEGDGEAGPIVDLKDRLAERVKKHFPESEADKLVERVGETQEMKLISQIQQLNDTVKVPDGLTHGPFTMARAVCK